MFTENPFLQKMETYTPNQELLVRYFLNPSKNRKADREEGGCLADCVESPVGLAERTSARIWKTLDKEKQNSTIISKPSAALNLPEKTMDSEKFQRFDVSKSAGMSDTFLNSAFYSPETFLPSSFLLQTSEEEVPEKKIKKERDDSEQKKFDEIGPPRRSSRYVGLIASISVGMLIALFLFPMIRMAMRSTQSYVTDSWTSEINRRVGQYEQIYGNVSSKLQTEEMEPFNWAWSDWQELHWDNSILQDFFFKQDFFQQGVLFQSSSGKSARLFEDIARIRNKDDANKTIDAGIVDTKRGENSSSAERSRFQDSVLLVLPGQEGVVRSAFGQSSMLKGGRIFLRSLPNAEPATLR